MPDNKVNIINGRVVPQFLGKPMQDAKPAKPEDNEVYALEKSIVTYTKVNEEVLEKQPEPMGGGVSSWNDLTDRPFYENWLEVMPLPDSTSGLSETNYVQMYMRFVGPFQPPAIPDNVPEYAQMAVRDYYSDEVVVVWPESIGTASMAYVAEKTMQGFYTCCVYVDEADVGTILDFSEWEEQGLKVTFPAAGMWVMGYSDHFVIKSLGFYELKKVPNALLPSIEEQGGIAPKSLYVNSPDPYAKRGFLVVRPSNGTCTLYNAAAVPDAAGETVTAAEFNALLAALRDVYILAEPEE